MKMKKILTLCIVSLFISAETFAIGPWTQKQSMEGPGRHRAFSMAIGNRGYVGGGWNGSLMYLDFWEYDPSNNSWTQKANCPTSFWSDPAFGIGIKGFVINGTTTYMFNPLNNTWSVVNTNSVGSSGYDQLKFVINGKGYAISSNAIYEFDPVLYTWTYKITLPSFWGDMAFAIGSKGYFVDAYYSAMFSYDPASNSYAYKTPPPASLTQGASWGVNGKGYIGCGQVPPNWTDEKYCYEYDPVLDSWKGINDFDGSGRENLTAFTIGSKAYLTCGTSGINMNDIWEFDNTQITGMDVPDLSASISIFPNPSIDGNYFVKEDGSSTVSSLKVYNMAGAAVKTISIHGDAVIDMKEMPNGEYFVVLFDAANNKCGTKKIILAK